MTETITITLPLTDEQRIKFWEENGFFGLNQGLRAIAAAAPSPWQSIETVPRDGTSILLSFGQDSVAQACWAPLHPGDPFPWKFFECDRTGNPTERVIVNAIRDGEYGPSHWQPMPSPWCRPLHVQQSIGEPCPPIEGAFPPVEGPLSAPSKEVGKERKTVPSPWTLGPPPEVEDDSRWIVETENGFFILHFLIGAGLWVDDDPVSTLAVLAHEITRHRPMADLL